MSILKRKLNNLDVVIVTHVFATGPSQELEVYLKKKVNTLMFIGHPFFYAIDVRSFYRVYKCGQLIKEKKAKIWMLPEILMYLKDFIYTLKWIIKTKENFDIYIGVNPLNAFSGLLLKIIKKTNKVILFTIDYVPKRFNSALLNSLYHWVDIFCINRCDFVWNLSPRMIRGKNSIHKKQIIVPVGVHFDRVKRLPIEEINRKHLVYLGHLRKGQGLELIIETLPDIIERIPDIKLIIVGTGYLEDKLKKRIKELEITNYVEFKGFIKNHKDVEQILTKCGVGLAVYEPTRNNFTWYADPSKPKQYMVCGLPVVITRVPWITEEIEKKKSGIVISYNKESLKNAIIMLLTNDTLYKLCRENAINFSSELDWVKIFDKAFAKLIK